MTRTAIARVKPEVVSWLRQGATLVVEEPAAFAVEGRGAVDCLQGVVTNDVVGPGTHSLGYGALLTPRGAIVVDFWVFRHGERFHLIAPRAGREGMEEVFTRRLPPRLARTTDLTGAWRVGWLLGEQVEAMLGRAELPWPEAESRVTPCEVDGHEGLIGRSQAAAPWAAVIAGPADLLATVADRLQEAGAIIGSATHLDAARVLQGWPAFGREIGDRTLPQEVRYDDIGGVSYTKGCYVGQETVARIHFRGHPNRTLRGLLWSDDRVAEGAPVTVGPKEVGTLTSVLEVGASRFGLTVLRREVRNGSLVTVGGATQARVVEVPFAPDLLPG